ncbi:hypothetical protein FIBSPDRAFT_684348, partial [Athelia psychrophila]
TCDHCHEEWFDLKVKDGKCQKCRANNKFQPSNNMYPGAAPDLPHLTQMEEMLISPVHALVQVWQIRGGQYKYTGHTCNFPRDTAVFHAKLPLLPQEVDVIIMHRTGAQGENNDVIHQDFRVRRHVLETWLKYLEEHHPTFRQGAGQQLQIDYERLEQLPVDGSVHEQLRNVESGTLDDAFQDAGPPESDTSAPDQQSDPIYSAGFVPNVLNGRTEEEILRQAALNSGETVVLPMPSVHGTPISEYEKRRIAIDAFPSLFPTGKADINETRDKTVDMKDWALHLLKLKGGRFAKHPRFRYWVLNTIMRHDAKKATSWYLRTHKEDKELNVEDIREML